MLFAAAYYVTASIAIAGGDFVQGSTLSGVRPTGIPDLLTLGISVFTFVTPVAAAYIVWMICHSLTPTPPALSALSGFLVATMVGYPTTVVPLFAPDHPVIAGVVGVVGLLCLGFALREVGLRQP